MAAGVLENLLQMFSISYAKILLYKQGVNLVRIVVLRTSCLVHAI